MSSVISYLLSSVLFGVIFFVLFYISVIMDSSEDTKKKIEDVIVDTKAFIKAKEYYFKVGFILILGVILTSYILI